MTDLTVDWREYALMLEKRLKMIENMLTVDPPVSMTKCLSSYEARAQEEGWNACVNHIKSSITDELSGFVLIPKKPSDGLLMSMAVRYDHGLGCPGYYDQPMMVGTNQLTHKQRLEGTIRQMSQLHEEVVREGFYGPEREHIYLKMKGEVT